jgi:hypothetical protein
VKIAKVTAFWSFFSFPAGASPINLTLWNFHGLWWKSIFTRFAEGL